MALSRELARCVTGIEEASLSKSTRENRLVASPLVQLGEGCARISSKFASTSAFELRGPATRQAATIGVEYEPPAAAYDTRNLGSESMLLLASPTRTARPLRPDAGGTSLDKDACATLIVHSRSPPGQDSPVEREGFEPSVPLARVSLDSWGGEGARGRSGWSRKTPSFFTGGPAVRIRLPPPLSLSHRCRLRLQSTVSTTVHLEDVRLDR